MLRTAPLRVVLSLGSGLLAFSEASSQPQTLPENSCSISCPAEVDNKYAELRGSTSCAPGHAPVCQCTDTTRPMAGCELLMPRASIEPRPRPEPTAEQREMSRWLKPRNRCAPVYPVSAVAAKQEGWVRLVLTISSGGEPVAIGVADSSPPGMFETAAIEGASKCRFEPKVVDGRAVPIEGVPFDIIFQLE